MIDIHHDSCPHCGRAPGPHMVLMGWHPCLCVGHKTRYCRDDNGGCGHTVYVPPLVDGRCRPPVQGFTAPPS